MLTIFGSVTVVHNTQQFKLGNTHLSFLLVEIVNNHTDEEIEGEEGAKNDEDDEVQVHVEIDFSHRLFLHLTKVGKLNIHTHIVFYSVSYGS